MAPRTTSRNSSVYTEHTALMGPFFIKKRNDTNKAINKQPLSEQIRSLTHWLNYVANIHKSENVDYLQGLSSITRHVQTAISLKHLTLVFIESKYCYLVPLPSGACFSLTALNPLFTDLCCLTAASQQQEHDELSQKHAISLLKAYWTQRCYKILCPNYLTSRNRI